MRTQPKRLLNSFSRLTVMSIFAGLLQIFSGSRAVAMPAQIVLLRHAEKPPQGPELSEFGWQRAQALPQVFANLPELQKFGGPVALFGMSPGRPGRSVRSIQTLTPLAGSTGLTIETRFRGRDFRELVNEVESNPAYAGKQIVICWRREEIPAIIEEFGGPEIADVRSKQYDSLWVLTPNRSGISVKLLRQSAF